ncbi:MAG: hypothetical protein N2557_06285 [Hydrogenophilus sp.]|nr:hypothetical protein [Hydrogenophilus sp.]
MATPRPIPPLANLSSSSPRTILWWGRYDPCYPRNVILRRLTLALGYRLTSFRPALSLLGHWQAALTRLSPPALIWVPAFRQRDLAAAQAWAKPRRIPIIADPLISAYDKQVYERCKWPPTHPAAERLRRWEQRLLAACDAVVVDTLEHARYFTHTLGIPPEKLHLIWVGADQSHFSPTPLPPIPPHQGPELLFWGTYLPLHGIEQLIAALSSYTGPPLRLTLIGDGPLRPRIEHLLCAHPPPPPLTLHLAAPIPYRDLPARIAAAHGVLGIFGLTPKAGRVIPNKIFQGLAAARPILTRSAPSYPSVLSHAPPIQTGIYWVDPQNPWTIPQALAHLAALPYSILTALAQAAHRTYTRYFSESILSQQLAQLLHRFFPPPR